MITSFDDYCIHQADRPIDQPALSDCNFCERYWFNGFDADASFLFEIDFRLYPNRGVMAGHFSVTVGCRQFAFHASRRAPNERRETSVGPLRVEVIEPLRQVRVVLAANEHRIECELVFTAAGAPHEEPSGMMGDGGQPRLHASRFSQLGYWSGYFSVDGHRQEVSRAFASRDRAWGVGPAGEPQDAGAVFYRVGCQVNFGDVCVYFGTSEDRDGEPIQLGAELLPLYDDVSAIPAQEQGVVSMRDIRHRIQWLPGTRRAVCAHLSMCDAGGCGYEISLAPVGCVHYLRGIGYDHAEWGHGLWKGELATGREEWDLNVLEPLDARFMRHHQMVRAVMGERVGFGLLEAIVIGPHTPSGFKDYFDGAP